MKKIISLLISIIFLLNTSLAYTVTIIIEEVNLSITRDAGEIVRLRTKLDKIRGWEVKSGGVTIDENQFIMPESDVVVEAIIQEEPTSKYMLIVENFGARSKSLKLANSEVVATATETNERIFTKWTAEGIELSPEEEINKTISFNMPENEVTLIANYALPTYTITYNKNTEDEVENMPETQTKTNGTELILSSNIPTRENYTFIGWSVNSNATQVEYQAGGAYTTESDTTLYAIWIENQLTQKTLEQSTGIVAKYEVMSGSQITTTATEVFTNWRWISVGKVFTNTYNYNRNLDSHLMRNSEWGAVAYLTNAIGRTPYINNNSNYITGRAGDSQDAEASGSINIWNTPEGVKASTTHNVYGIYDFSGGNWERVAAYYTGGDGTYLVDDVGEDAYAGALYNAVNEGMLAKYVEIYDTNYDSEITGDAMYEISSNSSTQLSWDTDNFSAPGLPAPVLYRGGGCATDFGAGLFSFGGSTGRAGEVHGFRAVLSIQ